MPQPPSDRASNPTTPDTALYIAYDPATATPWGWGHTPELAQAAALDHMREVDEAVPPCPSDESAPDHLERCEVMRLSVAQRHELDLLALLELV